MLQNDSDIGPTWPPNWPLMIPKGVLLACHKLRSSNHPKRRTPNGVPFITPKGATNDFKQLNGGITERGCTSRKAAKSEELINDRPWNGASSATGNPLPDDPPPGDLPPENLPLGVPPGDPSTPAASHPTADLQAQLPDGADLAAGDEDAP